MCKSKRMVLAVLTAVSVAASLPVSAEAKPTVSAASAVLYEPSSGLVLFEKDAHTVRSMASTTKLMTALLGERALAWDQPVCVKAEAVRVEGSSLGLRAGDTLTAGDLITGMLLASGNDAANAVALAVSPTGEAFAAKMNDRAARLGMRDSHFVTPSGLDADGHGSTAYDMALLGAAVLRRKRLAAVCAMKQAQVPIKKPARTLYVSNHNRLLSLYADAVGMKTGFTKKAGRCLVSAAERDGITLIAVTLNAPDDWNDHIRLYEYGFSAVQAVPWPQPSLSPVPVMGGTVTSVPVQVKAPPKVVIRTGETAQLTATVCVPSPVFAPVRQGDTVGTVTYRYGDAVTVQRPVIAQNSVQRRKRDSALQRWLCRIWTLLAALCR